MQGKIPLPDEQPIAVNAIRNKRAAITGEIAMHEREIDRLRADLVHLDATMRLFDPGTNPGIIPALRRYPRRTEWFARGEITHRVYDALRGYEIVSHRDLAKAAMAEKDIAETDKATRRHITARFNRVCYELSRRGRLEKLGDGDEARWKLAPEAPDLL
jgi:hypothetical protein